MEASPKSFIDTLRNIFEATVSTTGYDNSLANIFSAKLTDSGPVAASDIRRSPDGRLFEMGNKKLLLSDILNASKKTTQLSVIPIVGGCGTGKTTLTRSVYEHNQVKDHFELRAWIKVDGHELSPRHAAKGILKSASNISCAVDEVVRDTLRSKRCLIVFDGVESLSDGSWSHMTKRWFDFVSSGSIVVITTCRSDVADLIVGKEPFVLGQLSHNDAALSLFRHFAGHHKLATSAVSATQLMASNVAAMCGGNPLSLRLLGSLMRYHYKLHELLSSVDLSESLSLTSPDASAVILLCVWALPPYLRKCFAYCSLLPKGCALNKKNIIIMLVAHIQHEHHDHSNDYTPDSFVDELISRSFVSDITYSDTGEVIEFRMPELIRKIAEDVARVIFHVNVGVIGSIGEDAAKLSFTGECNSKQLQTMILSPTIYLGGNLDHSLAEFTDLRSLDLSCSGIRVLSEDIRALKELRYLNLSYTFIERLPDTVTDLLELQTLDLSWCNRLKLLPEGMHKLTNMIHLDLYQCVSLYHLPPAIGSLEKLISLPLFILGDKDSDSASLRDLGSLYLLEGRLEIRNLDNVGEVSGARYAMISEKHLDHLALSWSSSNRRKMADENCSEMLELLEPNKGLKNLDLMGYMGSKFPSWISSMEGLVTISISECLCNQLPSLGHLPHLKKLQLKGMRYIEHIGPKIYCDRDVVSDVFPSLEQLGLYDMPMLSEWVRVSPPESFVDLTAREFPHLETLTIEGCPRLKTMPSFPNLRHLVVCSSTYELLNYLIIHERPSSVLIKDTTLRMSLLDQNNTTIPQTSLRKLILFNIDDESIDYDLQLWGEPSFLEHFGILHCHQLTAISWPSIEHLRKVHILDCPNLNFIHVPFSSSSRIEELVIEDCPRATTINGIYGLRYLKKLIVRNCGTEFDVEDFKEHGYFRESLEYLWISGCLKFEERLNKERAFLSHIPVVILGNPKRKQLEHKISAEGNVGFMMEKKIREEGDVLGPKDLSAQPLEVIWDSLLSYFGDMYLII